MRVALPCVDLGVEVWHEADLGEPVVTYSFGNRCEHDVTLDLAAARVVARDAHGREVALAAFDPGGEIRALVMPARVAGRERIEYIGDLKSDVAQLCVDVGSLDRSEPAGERWVCQPGRAESAR
jgi:hypothetical protein